MRGKYSITVGNNILQYKFEIRRNITIIKGDSATGKTTLVDMIREYYENGEKSGVTLQCDKTCAVLEGRQWKVILESIHDAIIFIDEGNEFITSTEFAEAISNTDNYYVLVTRENLASLPYSVDEIYGIKASGKYGSLQKTYQEFYHIYGEPKYNRDFNPDVIIVEDSNSGYDFLEYISKDKAYRIIGADGKSNVFRLLNQLEDEKILVIADGAAFGPEMDRIVKIMHNRKKLVLFLPESFEWLILKSGIVKDVAVMLESPWEYIDSEIYMSWERYFTALLIEKTTDSYLKYTKRQLNPNYLNEKIIQKIMDEIPIEL